MQPVIALSDIHGQMLVFPALAKIRDKYPEAPVVFLGDYQDSAHHHSGFRVAQTIKDMQEAEPDKIFVIQGNHDASAYESLIGENNYWLEMDGEDVVMEAALAAGKLPVDMNDALAIVKRVDAALINWLGTLPLDLQIGKLIFVHAGLDLTLPDPVADTLPHDKYWLREDYWYEKLYPNYAHNPLASAIVTGHTPTSLITGIYDRPAEVTTLRNRTSSSHGILTVQYAGEYARFFIDGGNHSRPAAAIGNIAVFDADAGTLIDALEDE